MGKLLYFFSIVLVFSLSSCIEIIDDLIIHPDGSGTLKYTVNLSASKVKLNSYLALDSLDGKKVPSKTEIKTRIDKIIEELRKQDGITALTFSDNYDDYIFKIHIDFQSIDQLQTAIKTIVRSALPDQQFQELEHQWITHRQHTMQRSVTSITVKKMSNIKQEDIDDLKEGVYTSITRFDKIVVSCENKSAVISKNKLAVMMRTDPYSLIQKPELLDNTIYLDTVQSE